MLRCLLVLILTVLATSVGAVDVPIGGYALEAQTQFAIPPPAELTTVETNLTVVVSNFGQ
ncbi:MAG: hypothetical protein CMB80_31145 [Flammeovirgaceae bacterium]|nr:hypothetical protein [Flammeovirgaceae bacterium]